MVKLIIYSVLFAAFCGQDVFCNSHESELRFRSGGRIVGGNDTTIQSYPYQAYLLLYDGKDYYQCGGSILSTNYVLTAAHCLTGMQTIQVRIGSTNSGSGGLQYDAVSFNSHPFYNATTKDYDVGVVQVNNMDLDGTNARAISMVRAGSDVPDGKQVVLTGWGATAENGNVSSTLMVVSVPAVGRQRCNELLGNRVTSRMFCAGHTEGGKDTCQGDSGGPAVTDNKLAGITSFGFGCARPNSPGVYTRVGNLAIQLFIRMRTGLIM